MKKLIFAILALVCVPMYAHAQARYDNVAQTQGGQPAAGATINVFNATGTGVSTISATGASEVGNIVTITTTSAHGYSVGNEVAVSGVIVGGYNGLWMVTSVPTSTTFTYTAATAGLSASGSGLTSVSLANIYYNQGLSISQPNPFTADGLGNYGFWIANGTYIATIGGSGLTTYAQSLTLTLGGSGGGTPGGGNTAVQFNNSGVFGGDSTNFTYTPLTQTLYVNGGIFTQGNIFAENLTPATIAGNENSPPINWLGNVYNGSGSSQVAFGGTLQFGSGENPSATQAFSFSAGTTGPLAVTFSGPQLVNLSATGIIDGSGYTVNGAAPSGDCLIGTGSVALFSTCPGGASITINGGSALTSPVNFQNGPLFQNLGINFSASGSNVEANFTGTLNPAGITAPANAGDVMCGNSTPNWADCIQGAPIDETRSGSSYSAIPTSDNLTLVELSGTGTALTGPTLANNIAFSILNRGSGATYTPASGTVNGNSTQLIPPNFLAQEFTDNTNTFMPVLPTLAAFTDCHGSSNAVIFTASTGVFGCNTISGGGGSTFQVNGTNLSSSSTINFENSSAFNGLTATFTNPSAGNVQLGFSGTLGNAGLTNPQIGIAGVNVSLGGSTSSFPSPGAIGGTTPAAGTFTALTANTSFVLNGGPTVTGIQGTDTSIPTSGTVASGAGHPVCTDGNGGFTTSGCIICSTAPSSDTLTNSVTTAQAFATTCTIPASTLGANTPILTIQIGYVNTSGTTAATLTMTGTMCPTSACTSPSSSNEIFLPAAGIALGVSSTRSMTVTCFIGATAAPGSSVTVNTACTPQTGGTSIEPSTISTQTLATNGSLVLTWFGTFSTTSGANSASFLIEHVMAN